MEPRTWAVWVGGRSSGFGDCGYSPGVLGCGEGDSAGGGGAGWEGGAVAGVVYGGAGGQAVDYAEDDGGCAWAFYLEGLDLHA